MTRPLLTILLFFSLLNSATAQQLNHFWTKFIGGNHSDAAYDAVATPDGGIAFTGQTLSNGTGDIPTSFPTDTYPNLVVGKIDSNKQLAWLKVYGGSNEDIGYRICLTNDGCLAILGTTASGDGNVTGFRGTRDLWLLKLNASGNLIWQKTFGSANSGTLASDLIQTRDGGFMLMGSINGAGDDIPIHYSNSPFYQDWFLLKTDANGNKQWAKTLGGDKGEDYRGSIIEINDGYYLAGSSESRDHECTDTAWHPGANTKYDFYLLKLDQSGNMIWNKSFGGSLDETPAKAILDTRDSSILISGRTSSFDYMVNKTYIGSVTWLVKVSKDGSLNWTRILGEGLSTYEDGLILTQDGYMISTRVAGDIYDAGIYVVDTAGDKIIETKLGGSESDIPRALISYKGYAAIIGYSGSQKFTTGANLNNVNGGSDVFISAMGYWKTNIADINKENSSLNVFPNPADKIVTVTFSGKGRQKGRMTVHDSTGGMIYRRKIKPDTESITIETGQWRPGMYMVQWQDEDGQTAHAKFIHN